MFAANQIRKIIQNTPGSKIAQTFSRLILALEGGELVQWKELYDLPFDDFKLAIEVIRDWRLERYYKSKMKVLDLSFQHLQGEA